MTTDEIHANAARIGRPVGVGRIRRMLKDGIREGTIEHVSAHRTSINGVTRPVDAYRLVEK